MAGSKGTGDSHLKDEGLYQDLRDKGYSKEKSARISNAKANPHMHPSQKGGANPPYDDWTKDELIDRARELGVNIRTAMQKDEIISALRDH